MKIYSLIITSVMLTTFTLAQASSQSESEDTNPWEGLYREWMTMDEFGRKVGLPYFANQLSGICFHIMSPDSNEVMLIDHGLEMMQTGEWSSMYTSDSYDVPEKVTVNGKEYTVSYAFYPWNISPVKKISLPSTLHTVIGGLCWDCPYLEEIDLGAGLQRLGYKSFENTPNLRNVKVPETLTFIEAHCFNNSGIESIVLKNKLMSIMGDCFNECPNLKEITLPYSLRYLGNNCFNKCNQLAKIEMKGMFTREIKDSFNECPAITEIHFTTPIPPVITNSFNKIDKEKCIVYVPKGCLQEYKSKYQKYPQMEIFKPENIYEEGSGPAAVEMPAVETPEAQEEIYTLDGLRVDADEEAHGILIKRKGASATKVIK